jgi:hypothetical protein
MSWCKKCKIGGFCDCTPLTKTVQKAIEKVPDSHTSNTITGPKAKLSSVLKSVKKGTYNPNDYN